ncbi:DNA/RNA non-specific endonuclease [Speluncibacter jeojiensis]
MSAPAAPVLDTNAVTNLPGAAPSQIVPGSAPTNAPYDAPAAYGATNLQAPAALPNSMVTGKNADLVTLAGPQAMGRGLTALQLDFFSVAGQLMHATQGLPIPSNGIDTYALTRGFSSPQFANSAPVLAAYGASRFLAGPLDSFGRSTGVLGYLTPDSLGKGGGPKAKIDGLAYGQDPKYHRGHLCGNLFGCPGDVPQMLSPELGTINTGIVREWETTVARVVRGAEPGVAAQDVTFMKVPLYHGNQIRPYAYLMQAWGTKGWNMPAVYVRNYR